MSVAEVFIFEGVDPGLFPKVAGAANDRLIETLSDYPGFLGLTVLSDEAGRRSIAQALFASEQSRRGASVALETLAHAVALSLEARSVRRSTCTVVLDRAHRASR